MPVLRSIPKESTCQVGIDSFPFTGITAPFPNVSLTLAARFSVLGKTRREISEELNPVSGRTLLAFLLKIRVTRYDACLRSQLPRSSTRSPPVYPEAPRVVQRVIKMEYRVDSRMHTRNVSNIGTNSEARGGNRVKSNGLL